MAKQSNADELLELYRDMQRIRRFEEEAARAYAQGKIGGFLHLYIGQEAIAVGSCAGLEDDDYIFQSYRDHGIALARGMSAKAAMAELFGKDTGCSRGLGGSMHFFDAERNFLGGWGIVGSHLPLAAGAAFKAKYSGEKRISVCFFGEGATNIAGFHEALTLAGLWKLPVLWVCENNEYAMGTAIGRSSPVANIADKGAAYGTAALTFDGHDVLEVRKQIGEAATRVREGEGPILAEIKTYRFRGHSMSDPAKYRTKEELEERKKKDPVALFRAFLGSQGVTEEALDAADEAVETEIEEAVAFADASEPAKEETLRRAIYAP